MMRFVSSDHELRAAGAIDEHRGRIGGKAAGLLRLLELGCEVPRFFVVHADACGSAHSRTAADEVRAALEALGPGPYAVRSSGVDEDGAEHSHAGQFDSALGPRSAEEVLQAIGQCQRSADGERVRAYRRIRGLRPAPVAVVVQQLIPADAAGVMFTATPEDPDGLVISATWGLGEGVVQGQLGCDTWRIDEQGQVAAELEHKEAAIRADAGGTRSEGVSGDRRDAACLDEGIVRALAQEGRRIARALGRHVDVEFAVAAGKLWWLQLRPVTFPIPAGRRLLWDNSNIIESFNGPTTPMTYSFAARAYAIIYQLFCRAMGVDEAAIQAHASTFPRMIGRIRGRIYYNLNAWYLVLRLLPGFRYTRRWMEQMMGVAEVASDEDALSDWRPRSKLADAIRGMRAAAALVWRLVRLDADVARFRRSFEDAWRRHRREDFARQDLFQLSESYADLERRLLWSWTPPIVNDFFAMVFVGLLRRSCGAVTEGTSAGALRNDLLAAEGELESTAPTREAQRIAAGIRARPELLTLFRSELTAEALYERALRDPWLADELSGYVERFGDRCVDELKLETLSLRQRPGFLAAVLRNYVRPDGAVAEVNPMVSAAAHVELRRAAERRLFEALRGRPLKAAVTRWILRQARRRVKDRESLRFLRTRVFGLVRDLVRAMGERLSEAGAIDAAEDVFWLSIDEVFAYARGTAITTNLRGLVALRRAEAVADAEAPAPAERFHTWGPVYARNRFQSRQSARPHPSPLPEREGERANELFGTPCFPGRVEGEARVLSEPGDGAALHGEILVAARTDPGWVPLYPSISGLIVERGSVLSHSAVVARELGIPTIVGVRGLTAAISDGDRVRMDGTAGRVQRVSP